MVKLLRNIAVVAVALLSLTGCFKKVTTATTVCIKVVEEVQVMERVESVDNTTGEMTETLKEVRKQRLPAEGCYAYLYYTDSSDWTVTSYEDAAAKTLTNVVTGEKLIYPDAESSPYVLEGSVNNYISLYQEARPAMVVVVYPLAQMYAYMYRISDAENLPTTYLTLIFHIWKTGAYNEGSKEGYRWTIVTPETQVRPPVIEEPKSPEMPENPTNPEEPENPEAPDSPDNPDVNN